MLPCWSPAKPVASHWRRPHAPRGGPMVYQLIASPGFINRIRGRSGRSTCLRNRKSGSISSAAAEIAEPSDDARSIVGWRGTLPRKVPGSCMACPRSPRPLDHRQRLTQFGALLKNAVTSATTGLQHSEIRRDACKKSKSIPLHEDEPLTRTILELGLSEFLHRLKFG
jgi:hypothetical protein